LAKRIFILFWLFAAYAVVFAHSAIPHVHEEEHKAQADHQHNGAGHHHHEKEHPDEDSDDHAGNFHLYQHQDIRGDYFIPSLPLNDSQINKDRVMISFVFQQLVRLCDEGPPLQHFAKTSPHIRLQQQHFYFYPVKAPPVLS
jgi:hypothetical protein